MARSVVTPKTSSASTKKKRTYVKKSASRRQLEDYQKSINNSIRDQKKKLKHLQDEKKKNINEMRRLLSMEKKKDGCSSSKTR